MVLTVGKYILGKVLHADSESVVRTGTHKETQISYAIRMLEKAGIRRRGESEAIKRQVSSMSSIKHANIVQLHEVLSSPTRIYLVNELVEGEDLGAYVTKYGKLLQQNACLVIRTIAETLAYAHSQGVYHGAIAPSCILLPKGSPWTSVKITGFTQFQPTDKRLASAKDAIGLAALLALVISANPPPLPDTASIGARDLFAKLEHKNPLKRPSLREVLQHPWFDELNDDQLSIRNQRRNEVRIERLNLPTPQNDDDDDSSDEDGDTFPATMPMMATMDFLPEQEKNIDTSVKAFQQIESGRQSSPLSPVSPTSPDEFGRRRLPRSKPVRYPASPLREALIPSPKTNATSGNTSRKSISPRNVSDEHNKLRQQSSPLPTELTETLVLHRMPGTPPSRTNSATPTATLSSPTSLPRKNAKTSPVMKRYNNSPLSRRKSSRSPGTRDLASTPPPSHHDDAPMSSSTISLDDDYSSLTRLVHTTLPRYTTQRTKQVLDGLIDAGVDNIDDLKFVVQTKRSVKGAADWLERVTRLPAFPCLKIMQAAVERT